MRDKARPKHQRPTATAAATAAMAAPASRRPQILAIAALLLLILLAAAGLWWQGAPTPTPSSDAPPPRATAAPVAWSDNKTCLECHAAQAAEWQGSHHAKAMALPTPSTVLGNFDNASFTHQGKRTRFFRQGDAYMVNTEGPDGKAADFSIAYTFGWEPLQQYLIALPQGRLQPLSIAWDNQQKRWYHLLPNEKTPPGDVLHWTGKYQTANTMCIVCHTTGFDKGFDAATGSFASRWAEINVSCQSCHGPGERHLQWARNGAEKSVASKGLTLVQSQASPAQQVEQCAPCHARRTELTAQAQPGQPLLDQYQPSRLQLGLYHVDGQQLDEVYVDGSFRQSKMYQAGVACSNCHNPHSGKLRATGNAVCLQCHQASGNAAFAKAAGNYDDPAHHFHTTGSAGAQCVNCHMPSKVYMGIQARPDHSLRVPRPDLSTKLGTPNACNQCHDKQTAQWAAQAVARWYGPKRRQEPHFGELFASARQGQVAAAAGLTKLIADGQIASLVRASALLELANLSRTEGVFERVNASHDTSPEVRAAAAESLEAVNPAQRVPALQALLTDPVQAVRIAAARSLSALPLSEIEAPYRPALAAAVAEYIQVQQLALDMPGAQLNLAVLYQNRGETALAEQHYAAALRIDPDFTAGRLNLAQFYAATQRPAQARQVLQDGLSRTPQSGEMHYALGLLWAEAQALPAAAKALRQAAGLLPGRARVQYNLGLALQQMQQRKPAEEALLAAQKLDPQDPAITYALAVLYLQGRQRESALHWAQSLQSLNPAEPQLRALMAQIDALN